MSVPGLYHHVRTREELVADLRQRLRTDGQGVLWTRTLRLAGLGESQVADELADLLAAQKDPSIALYASPAEVRIRLASKAPNEVLASQVFAPVEQEIRKRLGAAVYGIDDETMEVAVGRALIAAGATDERNFVKKAVNWALRNIGKRDQALNGAAIALAREMQTMPQKPARWIASDALRELTSDKIQQRLARRK